jgi:hypothetical protein
VSDAHVSQLATFLFVLFGLDPSTTMLVLQAGSAVGSLGGALWLAVRSGHLGWRASLWVAVAAAAGWSGWRQRRAIAREVREIVKERMAAERAKARHGYETDPEPLFVDDDADRRILPKGGSGTAPPQNPCENAPGGYPVSDGEACQINRVTFRDVVSDARNSDLSPPTNC